jgi:hypothetical protein
MSAFLDFVYRFISKSLDTWTSVFLVISMTLLSYAIFPFSKNRLILVIILLIVGHINKENFGVRIGNPILDADPPAIAMFRH